MRYLPMVLVFSVAVQSTSFVYAQSNRSLSQDEQVDALTTIISLSKLEIDFAADGVSHAQKLVSLKNRAMIAGTALLALTFFSRPIRAAPKWVSRGAGVALATMSVIGFGVFVHSSAALESLENRIELLRNRMDRESLRLEKVKDGQPLTLDEQVKLLNDVIAYTRADIPIYETFLQAQAYPESIPLVERNLQAERDYLAYAEQQLALLMPTKAI